MLPSNRITVAVVYHNEESALPKLLASLENAIIQPGLNQFDFLFVNNDSADSSESLIEGWSRQYPKSVVHKISRSENHLAKARSQAIDLCETGWIAFVDADVELESDWGVKVISTLATVDSDVVAIGGSEIRIGNLNWHKYANELAQHFPIGKTQEGRVVVDHVPTNNYLLRTSIGKDLGGFDPHFQFVGEDLEFNIRLRKKGKILFESNIQVRHGLPPSWRAWLRKMTLYGSAQSFVFLYSRGGVPLLKFLPLAMLVGAAILIVMAPLFAVFVVLAMVLTSRVRFLFLSVLFYGIGELTGIFKYICLPMNLENFSSQTHKAK